MICSFRVEKCTPEHRPDDTGSLCGEVAGQFSGDRAQRGSGRTAQQKSHRRSREPQNLAEEGRFRPWLLGLVLFSLRVDRLARQFELPGNHNQCGALRRGGLELAVVFPVGWIQHYLRPPRHPRVGVADEIADTITLVLARSLRP
jgi:hypothetical protein